MRRSVSIISAILIVCTVMTGACTTAANVPVPESPAIVSAPSVAIATGENKTALFSTEKIQVPVWLSPGGKADYTIAT
jgi:hypothetical protein